MRRRVVLFLVPIALTIGAFTQAQSDPFVGTWKLNTELSKFTPGPGPKGHTRTWAADGTIQVDGVSAAGAAVAYRYTIRADGKPYAATGSVPNGADSVSSKRIDANTIEATFTRGGKAADSAKFVVSADGKTLTLTAKGTLADGRPLLDVLVYNRQ